MATEYSENPKEEDSVEDLEDIPPCCCSSSSPEEKRRGYSLKDTLKRAFHFNAGKRKRAMLKEDGEDDDENKACGKCDICVKYGIRGGALKLSGCNSQAVPHNNVQVTIEHVNIIPDHTHSESVVCDMRREGVTVSKSQLLAEEDSRTSCLSDDSYC